MRRTAASTRLKSFGKHLAHWVIQGGHPGPSPVTVLGGPLKGLQLNLDLRTQGSYWLGNYDNWILKRVPLRLLISKGQTVWDGGAFVGFYTALFRLYVGPTGAVHSFEASPKNFQAVTRIRELNKWSNVHFHDVAIGPDHSEISFAAENGGSSGPVGLVKGIRAGVSHGVVTVRSCGVDELIGEMHVPSPDFVKFDLETGEIFALANGSNLFKRRHPILLLELHGRDCLAAALKFADQFNYYLTDLYSLPSQDEEATLLNPAAWVEAFLSASIAFLANPPREGYPHMLLAIPKDGLQSIAQFGGVMKPREREQSHDQ